MEAKFIQGTKGKIATVIHRPESEGVKLSIICPGYLDTKDYQSFITFAESLSSLGYTAIRFDPTGVWESEGNISDYTDTQYLSDIKSIIDFFDGDKKYNEIILIGHSRGGMISILYAAQDSKVTKVIAIEPSSKKTFNRARDAEWKEKGFRVSTRDIPNSVEIKKFEVPFSHAVDADRYDVFEEVKKISVPILFIAGELDTTVPAEIVKDLYNQANEPKKFVLLKNIGHSFRRNQEETNLVNDIIISYLNP